MSAFSSVLAAFEARKIGGTFKARCPAHDDKVASLAIAEGQDGRVLLKCHAGCSLQDVLSAAGLRLSDLFEPRGNGNGTRAGAPPREAPRAREVAAYHYRDESGRHLYSTIRYEPKGFSQRRADGASTLAGCRRVLYRLDDLLESGLRVVIVEGEKDADRLWEAGIPATSSVCGATHFSSGTERDSYGYGAQLRKAGFEFVAVIADNDAAGKAHALQVKAACESVGLETRIISLPGLGEKEDVSNYLDRNPPTKLQTLIDRAFVRRVTERVSMSEVTRVQAESVSWLWYGHIPLKKISAWVGPGGVGKSTMLYDVAARVSTGAPWPNGGSAEKGAVLLIGSEDGIADTIKPRLVAAGADCSMIRTVDGIENPDGSIRSFNLKDDSDRLCRLINLEDVRLVILDPVLAFLGEKVSANYEHEVRPILEHLAGLLEDTRAALVFVMHLNKSEGRSVMNRASGSTAFLNVARVVHFAVERTERSGDYVLAVQKLNLTTAPPALQYRIVSSSDDVALIQWGGETRDSNLSEILAPRRPDIDASAVRLARQAIIDFLGELERPVRELEEDVLSSTGVGRTSFFKATIELGVKRRLIIDPKTKKRTYSVRLDSIRSG